MAPKEAFRLEFSYTCCAAEFIVSRTFAIPAKVATPLLLVLSYHNESNP